MQTQPVDSLLKVMATLRAPTVGCPWDIEQSFETIAPYTIEEAYEVAEAIRQGDLDALREELGDLLFQVVFHARMAEEARRLRLRRCGARRRREDGRPAPACVRRRGVVGCRRRRPATGRRTRSASAGARRPGAAAGLRARSEDVPFALPALLRAEKLQRRAARQGFDWPDAAPVYDKVREELDELAAPGADLPAELGDVLFSVVNLARKLDIAPETALRAANARFERRFRRVEVLARERGLAMKDASLAVLDGLWERAKREQE